MISKRVQGFTESVIREMTRVSAQHGGGVNLAQGFPNFPPPRVLVEAAHRALDGDFHQYAITWGARNLREAIADEVRAVLRPPRRPGAPGDRVLRLHGGHAVDAPRRPRPRRRDRHLRAVLRELRAGRDHLRREARLRAARAAGLLVRPRPPGARLHAADAGDRVQQPEQPDGQGVLARASCEIIAELCQRHDVLAITDEIYEHIVYDGAPAHPRWRRSRAWRTGPSPSPASPSPTR